MTQVRHRVCAALVLAGLGFAAARSEAEVLERLAVRTPFDCVCPVPIATAMRSYLSVLVGSPDDVRAVASATLVADGLALTNAHVAAAAPEGLLVRSADGRLDRAAVLASSRHLDLAVLAVPRGIAPPVTEGTDAVVSAQEVWLLGTTLGREPVERGRVLLPSGLAIDVGRAGMDEVWLPDGRPPDPAPVAGFFIQDGGSAGFSGGPVFDSEGRWVGLIQGVVVRWGDGRSTEIERAPVAFAYRAADVRREMANLLRRAGVSTGGGARGPGTEETGSRQR